MRSTPTDSARGASAVTSAAGRPWFSIDFASVDPLRVPVPQVAPTITACTPSASNARAISLPIRVMSLSEPMLPVVLNR